MKPEPSSGIETNPLTAGLPIDRRNFLKTMGGGITFLFTIGLPLAGAQPRGRMAYPSDFNAYLKIGADGRVSCFTGKIEMGQGIITSLAQMLAEELDVALSRVDMVMGDTALCPYDMGTTGSRSTKNFGPPLRQAAAEARHVLIGLAADRLSVPRDRLSVKDGVILDGQSPDRKVSYAELAGAVSMQPQPEGDIGPKQASTYTVCGKATLRTDALQKVTGAARFAGDIHLPGMLHAKVLRPPAHGARLKTVDTGPAKDVPGAVIVEENDLVAALHEMPDMAEKALRKIEAEFETPAPSPDNHSIFDHLLNAGGSGQVVTEKGDIDTGRTESAALFENTFYNHYVAHAPIEPHAVTVDIRENGVTVWASTQTPFQVRDSVAETLGVPSEKVRVTTPFLGGGFGGKKSGLDIVQAARLAKITGRAVQISLSRKEEYFYDTFRPASVIKARSGIDGAGKIRFWDFEHFFPGRRSSEPIYDIPHCRVVSKQANRGETGPHPFETGAWRGPGSNSNVHAMESQTDTMARAAGVDPLSFRLKNLSDRRMIRVLEAAANRFGKSFSKSPSGKGHGIACTNYLNTYVATMAEVAVDRETGRVRVNRVVCSQDMGEIVNPQGARLQIEGGIVMGLGYCLTEEVEFQGARVLTENFDTYAIPRFSWVPRIEVELVENPGLAPQGCGEPAITTMGGVIANAIYDAIGVQLFTLPMTARRIRDALKKL